MRKTPAEKNAPPIFFQTCLEAYVLPHTALELTVAIFPLIARWDRFERIPVLGDPTLFNAEEVTNASGYATKRSLGDDEVTLLFTAGRHGPSGTISLPANNGPFGPLFASLAVVLTDNVAMGRRKLFTRENVLNKTIPVFWKHGLAETSVQDLEQATGVRKSGLYAEFKDKEDLFVASIRQYFDMLTARGTLTKQPLGWNNVEGFLKVCYGSWGQKGCFSVNSMREFADLPPKARQIMIANMTKAHQLLIDNLAAARGGTGNNESLADLIITFFCGICLEQNLGPDRTHITKKIEDFMQLIRGKG